MYDRPVRRVPQIKTVVGNNAKDFDNKVNVFLKQFSIENPPTLDVMVEDEHYIGFILYEKDMTVSELNQHVYTPP